MTTDFETPGHIESVHEDTEHRNALMRNLYTAGALGGSVLALVGAGLYAPAVGHADSCVTTQEGDSTTVTCVSDTYTETPPTTAAADPTPTPAQAHTFVDYNQNHNGFKWGKRVAATGCGPTSAAMVVATLEGDRAVTPKVIVRQVDGKYYFKHSGMAREAFPAIAKHYGLVEKRVKSLAGAEMAIEDGGLAIVHARPGHFTKAGHYMVLKAFANGRFRIADPNNAPGRDSETRNWTPRQLREAGVDEIYTFNTK